MNSRTRLPVKSWMGEMSRNISCRPSRGTTGRTCAAARSGSASPEPHRSWQSSAALSCQLARSSACGLGLLTPVGGHQEAPRLEVPTAEALDVSSTLPPISTLRQEKPYPTAKKKKAFAHRQPLWAAFPGRHSLLVSRKLRFMHISGELSARFDKGRGSPDRPVHTMMASYHVTTTGSTCQAKSNLRAGPPGSARSCHSPKRHEGWSRACGAPTPTLLSGKRTSLT